MDTSYNSNVFFKTIPSSAAAEGVVEVKVEVVEHTRYRNGDGKHPVGIIRTIFSHIKFSTYFHVTAIVRDRNTLAVGLQ